MRTFATIVLVIAACRPEPVLNPNKAPPRGGPPEVQTTQDVASDGTVTRRDGTAVELASLWREQKLVVIFYRGHWCPHCQHQLGELNDHREELEQHHANVIAISSDSREDAEMLHAKLGLGFEVYADPSLAVITKWGVSDYANGIALPATFVVEKGGAITYRHIGSKPSDHPSLDELLTALH